MSRASDLLDTLIAAKAPLDVLLKAQEAEHREFLRDTRRVDPVVRLMWRQCRKERFRRLPGPQHAAYFGD
jgi:hypothetical protein